MLRADGLHSEIVAATPQTVSQSPFQPRNRTPKFRRPFCPNDSLVHGKRNGRLLLRADGTVGAAV